MIYRRNTVKGEAISDKNDFADVNAALTCVDINGDDLPLNNPLPTPMIFEDNRLIGNVNLIAFGSGYGIGGSAHFYRSKLEKISHTDGHFAPFRLGFWYWNTRDNYMIDAICGEGVDLEQPPRFYGSTRYIEVFYGQTKKVFVTDRCNGVPLCNTAITISTEGRQPIHTKTDNEGYVTFEMLTVRHLKADNVISHTDYVSYSFAVAGHPACTIATEALKIREGIALDDPLCDPSINAGVIANSKVIIFPSPASSVIYLNGLIGNETIRIIDSAGRLLLTQKATSQSEKIEVSGFASGFYLIEIEGTKPAETFKVVIR